MPNNYYERLSEMNPGELADGLAMEQEFDAIGRGFNKLPAPHRDGHGFEGPTRVGDPVEETDAVNLGTLEKLNLPIYRKKITTEDWNTITDAGIYDVANASGSNKPQGYPYGVLTVYKFNGVVSQQYSPDSGGALLKRVCTNVASSSWGDWDVVYSSSMGAPCFRNKIINGDFSVNQRGYRSGMATSAGTYTLDRWKASSSPAITISSQNGVATITIPDGQSIQQVIEGINILSGNHVLSWDGSSRGRINSGAYGLSGEVVADLVGGDNVIVEFGPGTLSIPQLEFGVTKTKFEKRPIQIEQMLCMRYFENGSYDCSAYYSISGNRLPQLNFKVKKRAVPTMTAFEVSGVNFPSVSFYGATDSYVGVATGAGNVSQQTILGSFKWDANSEL